MRISEKAISSKQTHMRVRERRGLTKFDAFCCADGTVNHLDPLFLLLLCRNLARNHKVGGGGYVKSGKPQRFSLTRQTHRDTQARMVGITYESCSGMDTC